MQLYYAATVVFLLLDFSFGINLRIASLDAWPGWRALYYLLCFVCLVLTLWRPSLSLWVGTAESLMTLCMLIIATGARVLAPAESRLGAGGDILSTEAIFNFLIAGTIALFAYHRGMRAIQGTLRP